MESSLEEIVEKILQKATTRGCCAFFVGSWLLYVVLVIVGIVGMLRHWTFGTTIFLIVEATPSVVILAISGPYLWRAVRSLFRGGETGLKQLLLSWALRLDEGIVGAQYRRNPQEISLFAMVVQKSLAGASRIVTRQIDFFVLLLYVKFKWLRLFRIDFGTIWKAGNVLLAYKLRDTGNTYLSLFVAIAIVADSLNQSLENLNIKKGVVVLFRRKGTVSPSSILVDAILLAAAFGCIHYNVSQANYNEYNVVLDKGTSLYFSMVTLATVGYGDVFPRGVAARWTCMAEIVSGLVLLVISVNATMTVWLQSHQTHPSEDRPLTPSIVEWVEKGFTPAVEYGEENPLGLS
jgi:hypothetical protein